MNRRGFFSMLAGLVASFFGVKALPPVKYGHGIPYWLVRDRWENYRYCYSRTTDEEFIAALSKARGSLKLEKPQ